MSRIAAAARPRRTALRRAHLLEQEVTLAYVRELAASGRSGSL